MPFKSERQRRYMHANHPTIAKRWERKSFRRPTLSASDYVQHPGIPGQPATTRVGRMVKRKPVVRVGRMVKSKTRRMVKAKPRARKRVVKRKPQVTRLVKKEPVRKRRKRRPKSAKQHFAGS